MPEATTAPDVALTDPSQLETTGPEPVPVLPDRLTAHGLYSISQVGLVSATVPEPGTRNAISAESPFGCAAR
jgi:hypothetical protein